MRKLRKGTTCTLNVRRWHEEHLGIFNKEISAQKALRQDDVYRRDRHTGAGGFLLRNELIWIYKLLRRGSRCYFNVAVAGILQQTWEYTTFCEEMHEIFDKWLNWLFVGPFLRRVSLPST